MRICAITDLTDRRARVFDLGKEQVAVVRDGEAVYAFEGRCSHAFKPLEGARVRGDKLMCPHHGARFDLATGRHEGAPAVTGIKTYKVTVEDGSVFVQTELGTEETP